MSAMQFSHVEVDRSFGFGFGTETDNNCSFFVVSFSVQKTPKRIPAVTVTAGIRALSLSLTGFDIISVLMPSSMDVMDDLL